MNCIHRAGCINSDNCEKAGHCTSYRPPADHARVERFPEKLPCEVTIHADDGGGKLVFGKGIATVALLGYLTRRVEYNNEPPLTEEQRAAFRALRGVEIPSGRFQPSASCPASVTCEREGECSGMCPVRDRASPSNVARQEDSLVQIEEELRARGVLDVKIAFSPTAHTLPKAELARQVATFMRAILDGKTRVIPDTECLDCGSVKTECADDCPRVRANGGNRERDVPPVGACPEDYDALLRNSLTVIRALTAPAEPDNRGHKLPTMAMVEHARKFERATMTWLAERPDSAPKILTQGWRPAAEPPLDGLLVVGKWASHPPDTFQTLQVAFIEDEIWYAWHYGSFAARLVPPVEWAMVAAQTQPVDSRRVDGAPPCDCEPGKCWNRDMNPMLGRHEGRCREATPKVGHPASLLREPAKGSADALAPPTRPNKSMTQGEYERSLKDDASGERSL